jgi:hypothetical protein
MSLIFCCHQIESRVHCRVFSGSTQNHYLWNWILPNVVSTLVKTMLNLMWTLAFSNQKCWTRQHPMVEFWLTTFLFDYCSTKTERSTFTDKGSLLQSKPSASLSPLPSEADRSWLPIEAELPVGLVSPSSTLHDRLSGPSYNVISTVSTAVQTTIPSPKPMSGALFPCSTNTMRDK